jgi:high frequency lysogenization protein
MRHTDTDRCIALAGIFQAVRLVRDIATTGNYDAADFETCIQSLFRIDAATAEDVYASSASLATGFHTLMEQLAGKAHAGHNWQTKDINITKYAMGVLVLERQLRKDPAMLKTIADGIDKAKSQAAHFTITHDNVIANLAHLYTQTISTLRPRIMVSGEHAHIANPNHANRIRALLLAAIRAAVLWRQCGGTRWQLLLKRRAVLDEANRLLGSHRTE